MIPRRSLVGKDYLPPLAMDTALDIFHKERALINASVSHPDTLHKLLFRTSHNTVLPDVTTRAALALAEETDRHRPRPGAYNGNPAIFVYYPEVKHDCPSSKKSNFRLSKLHHSTSVRASEF